MNLDKIKTKLKELAVDVEYYPYEDYCCGDNGNFDDEYENGYDQGHDAGRADLAKNILAMLDE